MISAVIAVLIAATCNKPNRSATVDAPLPNWKYMAPNNRAENIEEENRAMLSALSLVICLQARWNRTRNRRSDRFALRRIDRAGGLDNAEEAISVVVDVLSAKSWDRE